MEGREQMIPLEARQFSQDEDMTHKQHIPRMLEWTEKYGAAQIVDEREFEIHDPSSQDPDIFEKELARDYLNNRSHLAQFQQSNREMVAAMVQSLGRLPDPVEIRREEFRHSLFEQIQNDETNPLYLKEEIEPQQKVIERRKKDFPAPEHALEAFRDGQVHVEEKNGVTRLIIEVPNQKGEMVEHPVMTDEEIEWVRKSADTIARVMREKPDSKIFIAGLGLGLLNKELVQRGVVPGRQVVAELNTDVIKKIGGQLKNQFGTHFDVRQGTSQEVFEKAMEDGEHLNVISVVDSTEQMMQKECPPIQGELDIRQGDFKAVLQEAVDKGELFEAISIDAFPNTAEEVNRDASSKEVLELALSALKPGGMLTFYPDSRYIPKRIWEILHQTGIPDTSMNYTVAKFKTSEFTQSYHYGELMAVVHIQKPLLDKDVDQEKIDGLVNQYYDGLDDKIQTYVDKHRDALVRDGPEHYSAAA